MVRLVGIFLLGLLFSANAQAQQLSDMQWREDIQAAVDAIHEYHPDPFWSVDEDVFADKTAALLNDLPRLSDKDTVLRLAELVSLVEDGHTRLSLPRTHTAFAFNPAHTGPDKPAHTSLTFSVLPFRFFLFDDGLHIVEAAKGYEQYLGAKITAFGKTETGDAIKAVRPILYAENDMGVKVLAADRLALSDVLKHFNLIGTTDRVPLTLEQGGQTRTIDIAPLSPDADVTVIPPEFDGPSISRQNRDTVKWHGRIPGERAWYIRIDEIEMFPEVLLSDFMHDALRQAKRVRAQRVLIDLRHNHGGTASFNASVINAVATSDYNQYGRLFVLTGRETFSAASMLVSEFEQYTNAIFVGEPSSARPSSYGDPKKIQLPNSGLTLRTSTLYWQSWLAGDFRTMIDAHIDVPPTAVDYFAGKDPAIGAALNYSPPDGIAAQMAELFDKEKLQSGLIRFFGWLNAPMDGDHNEVNDIIATGHTYLDAGELKKGRFMMVMARDYFPTNADARAGLGRALELKGEIKSAVRRYKEALELDPDQKAALKGLARLNSKPD